MMIDKTIKNKKAVLYKVLEGILTAKISEKKKLYKVLEGILTGEIANIKNIFFLSFLCLKRLDIKMANITMRSFLKCEIEVIDKGKYFWINRKHLEIESDFDIKTKIQNRDSLSPFNKPPFNTQHLLSNI